MARNQAADSLRALLACATEEATLRGDRRLGTDHLLLGLLHQADTPAARALGISLADARAALDALDRAALAAIGVTVTWPGAAQPVSRGRRMPPLTSGARAVLGRAMEAARPRRRGRLDSEHFLLAILAGQRPDPAAELLHALRVEAEPVRVRLGAVVPGGVT